MSDYVRYLKGNTPHTCCFFLLIALSGIFLLQSLREFFSSIFYYSLVDMGFSPTIVFLVVIASPLLVRPLTSKMGWRGSFMISGTLMVLFRLPLGFGIPQPYHLACSALALAGSSMFMTVALALYRRERTVDPDAYSSQAITASFGISLMTVIFFTTLGRSLDASTVPDVMGFRLAPILSAVMVFGSGFLLFVLKDASLLEDNRGEGSDPSEKITGGVADSKAPAFGLGFFLFVGGTMTAYPHVTTGWTGSSYQVSLSMTVLAIALFVMSLITSWKSLIGLRSIFSSPKGAIFGNVVLIASAANLFFFHYNLYFMPLLFVWIGMVNLWLILDAMTDNEPFAGEPIEIQRKDGQRKVLGFPGKKRHVRNLPVFASAVVISLGVFILLGLLQTFAVTWAHIPLGTAFRGTLPFTMFAATTGLALTGFACSKKNIEEPAIITRKTVEIKKGSPALAAYSGSGHIHKGQGLSKRLRTEWLTMGAVAIVLLGGISVSAMLIDSYEIDTGEITSGGTIRVMTYNIHQGFNNDGRADLLPQYEIIKRIDPDIIFLQESEGLRVNTGVTDPVYYLANRLNMYYHRGPRTGEGIHGVALLSRFPLSRVRIHFLDSEEDQRVAVSCRADLGEEHVNLVSVHIGLSDRDREVQISELAGIVGKMDGEVIVGGDFNSGPGEPFMVPFNSTLFGGNANKTDESLGFRSCWHEAESRNMAVDVHTWPASDLDDEHKHIDYILVSEGFVIGEAGIEDDEKASDHRPVWADLIVT
ncbi:MAG: endonuclease/exonuclease/phosphatase family protein [Thermoplasmatota archaeon]